MSKTKLAIVIAVVAVIGIAAYFYSQSGLYQKEDFSVEENVTPVELTQEEIEALKAEGIDPASADGSDGITEALRRVRTSDELGAIEADITGTDSDNLDAGLDSIDKDLLF